jgi:hypothetical protein
MAEERAAGTGMLELAAAMIASALVGAPLVVALVVRMLLFSLNPRGIELPGYDAEVVFAFVATFTLALVAVVLVLRGLRARVDRQALRIPYMILAVQVAIGAVAATVLLFTPR